MPHFFFHVRNGSPFNDTEGYELPHLSAAKIEAVRLAGQLLYDEPDKLLTSVEWVVEVTDGRGPLFSLRIAVDPANESS